MFRVPVFRVRRSGFGFGLRRQGEAKARSVLDCFHRCVVRRRFPDLKRMRPCDTLVWLTGRYGCSYVLEKPHLIRRDGVIRYGSSDGCVCSFELGSSCNALLMFPMSVFPYMGMRSGVQTM